MQETQETWVQSLGQERALEQEMVTRSSILAQEIPWREEPGGLLPTGSQRDMTEHAHTKLTLPKWKGKEGRDKLEYGINRYKLLHIKQIGNKDLLCNTGNYIQYPIITYNGTYLENSAVATEMEKVSFHSNPKRK